MKKPAKKSKPPLFRIEIWCNAETLKWTSTIRSRNGLTCWSSGSQQYSRQCDALRLARKLARAFKSGRVEIQA